MELEEGQEEEEDGGGEKAQVGVGEVLEEEEGGRALEGGGEQIEHGRGEEEVEHCLYMYCESTYCRIVLTHSR